MPAIPNSSTPIQQGGAQSSLPVSERGFVIIRGFFSTEVLASALSSRHSPDLLTFLIGAALIRERAITDAA
jgi:hypothetical protein